MNKKKSIIVIAISCFCIGNAFSQSLIQDAYNQRPKKADSSPRLVHQKKFCHYTGENKLTYCYFFERECKEKLAEEKDGSCREEILSGGKVASP